MPFEFLAQVEGESKIMIQFTLDQNRSQSRRVAAVLAENAGCLTSRETTLQPTYSRGVLLKQTRGGR